jgi:hypothetical protein
LNPSAFGGKLQKSGMEALSYQALDAALFTG